MPYRCPNTNTDYGIHDFAPGQDIDQIREGWPADPTWCNVCGESTRKEAVTCKCLPCTQPAYGAPGWDHCAACCGATGILEYAHDCPDGDHAEMAVRQFGPVPELH